MTPTVGGTSVSVATVSSDSGDPDVRNNIAILATTVLGAPEAPAPGPLPPASAEVSIALGKTKFVRSRTSNKPARWRNSRLRGYLLLRGTANADARVTILLGPEEARQTAGAANGGTVRRRITVPAGAFSRRLKLPKRTLFPGRHVLSISSAGSVAAQREMALQRPSEGVVRSAKLSPTRNGPDVNRLRRRPARLWATFELAALPRRGNFQVRWYAPGGTLAPDGVVSRRAAKTVKSNYCAVPGRCGQGVLQTGRWRVELRNRGKTVWNETIRIG